MFDVLKITGRIHVSNRAHRVLLRRYEPHVCTYSLMLVYYAELEATRRITTYQ
jgi:hypothetical protein